MYLKFGWINLSLLALMWLSSGGLIQSSYAQSDRVTDPVILQQGQSLFRQNCAVCHGGNAQGNVKDWQTPGSDGKLPAPPLNGTAHTWHHPIRGLAQTIQNGTIEIGGSMPPWRGKLSQDDTFAIIVWLSSLWPDDIYNAWMERNRN
ncbi:MAG: mono/diheme cytochrome c family protein [Parasphingorhabdus sp.]|jgi:mono/diheme cytochrome c family protein